MIGNQNYFVRPKFIASEKDVCYDKKTYSGYNYLSRGIISYIKSRHFKIALRLTKDYFHRCNVIDFGCADGPFLPSLSKFFNHVVGIDRDNNHIRLASKLCKRMALNNVRLICNHGLDIKKLKSKLLGEKYRIIYLLETIEHIGDRRDLFGSKITFLEHLSSLIEKDGIIVISAPKMIGTPFLVQRIGLALFGLRREPISFVNLLKASFFNDTSDLEKKWAWNHLGFNYKKFENYLKKWFNILQWHDLYFSVVYVIKKK